MSVRVFPSETNYIEDPQGTISKKPNWIRRLPWIILAITGVILLIVLPIVLVKNSSTKSNDHSAPVTLNIIKFSSGVSFETVNTDKSNGRRLTENLSKLDEKSRAAVCGAVATVLNINSSWVEVESVNSSDYLKNGASYYSYDVVTLTTLYLDEYINTTNGIGTFTGADSILATINSKLVGAVNDGSFTLALQTASIALGANATASASILDVILAVIVTAAPTGAPTLRMVTNAPSSFPTTLKPSAPTTPQPSSIPSIAMTVKPSLRPTSMLTPVTTLSPSLMPSILPSTIPSAVSSTRYPTVTATVAPSQLPSMVPSTRPSNEPTVDPSVASTDIPTLVPTNLIHTTTPSSNVPTAVPSNAPSAAPTTAPTVMPSTVPSTTPSNVPTIVPTTAPTTVPTTVPTTEPSNIPSAVLTTEPTITPSITPSTTPTTAPIIYPTIAPTTVPTTVPSTTPSIAPSNEPTYVPTNVPTTTPTTVPSAVLSNTPTAEPTTVPTTVPTIYPTMVPTTVPTVEPSNAPTSNPTTEPSLTPTIPPSFVPSLNPTTAPPPSITPTEEPTYSPSTPPTLTPSTIPTAGPSELPTDMPSAEPTINPTTVPSPLSEMPTISISPSFAPSEVPSLSPTASFSQAPVISLWPTTTSSPTLSQAPTFSPTETEAPSLQPTETPLVHAVITSFARSSYGTAHFQELLTDITSTTPSMVVTTTSILYLTIPVYPDTADIMFPNDTASTVIISLTPLTTTTDIPYDEIANNNATIACYMTTNISAIILSAQELKIPFPSICPPSNWTLFYPFNNSVHYIAAPLETFTVFDDSLFSSMMTTGITLTDQLVIGYQFLNISAATNHTAATTTNSSLYNSTSVEEILSSMTNVTREVALTSAFSSMAYLFQQTEYNFVRGSQPELLSSQPSNIDYWDEFDTTNTTSTRRLFTGSSAMCVLSEFTDVANRYAAIVDKIQKIQEVLEDPIMHVLTSVSEFFHVLEAGEELLPKFLALLAKYEMKELVYAEIMKVSMIQRMKFFLEILEINHSKLFVFLEGSLKFATRLSFAYFIFELIAKVTISLTTIGVLLVEFNEIANIGVDMYNSRCLIECETTSPFSSLPSTSLSSLGTDYRQGYTGADGYNHNMPGYQVPLQLPITVDEFSLDPSSCFAQQNAYIVSQIVKFLNYRRFFTFGDALTRLDATIAGMSKARDVITFARVLETKDVVGWNGDYMQCQLNYGDSRSMSMTCQPGWIVMKGNSGTVHLQFSLDYRLANFLPKRTRSISYDVTVNYPTCITEIQFYVKHNAYYGIDQPDKGYFTGPTGRCCGNYNYGATVGYPTQPAFCTGVPQNGFSTTILSTPTTFGCVTLYNDEEGHFTCKGHNTVHHQQRTSFGYWDVWVCECHL